MKRFDPRRVDGRRRLVIAALATAPISAIAQPASRVFRVGMLVNGIGPKDSVAWFKTFDDQLARHGFVVGRNLDLKRIIDWGSITEGRTIARAKELVAARCDVIVVEGTGRARILIPLAASTPIVLAGQADPLRSGFVKNLSKPGGSVTGVSNQECDLVKKRFELVRELVPGARRVVLLWDSTVPCDVTKHALLGDAPIELVALDRRHASGPNALLQAGLSAKPDVIIVFAVSPQREIDAVRKTLEHARRTPIISDDSWTEGTIITLTHDSDAIARSIADQVAKILGGARPGELPIEFVGKFELIVNRRRAREIGLGVPESILLRADRIVE